MSNLINYYWGAEKNINNPICDIIEEYRLFDSFFLYFDKYKYSNFYCHLFGPIREDVENVLEIGVFTGGGMFLWKKYFPNIKRMIAIDCTKDIPAFKDNILDLNLSNCSDDAYYERYKSSDGIIDIFIMDAYDDRSVSVIKEEFRDIDMDIIIDDGPHSVSSWKYFMDHYDSLSQNGILIIEDIHQPLIKELRGYNENYIAFGGDYGRSYGDHVILPSDLEIETKDLLLINDKRN